MSPRVAVIVRTKDRPYFLRRALADIAAQSFEDVLVTVVNDRGDRSQVDAIVSESPIVERIRVIDTEEPGGRCAAANAGIRASDAPYVVIHDDDDLWHPDFLTRTVAVLDASPGDAGVMVATEIVYEQRRGGEWVESSREPFWAGLTGVTFMSLLEINRAVPISFLYRRALHDELGLYDERLDAVEDWDFYLRVTARHPVSFLGGTPLAYWTQRPSAKGADGNSMFELATEHERDDLVVRDAALRAWVADNGAGLPLYIALVEKRIRTGLLEQLAQQQGEIAQKMYDAHPLWGRLRRLRRRRRR